MIIMKHFLNLFAILLATVILCTGCEKKSIVDTIAEMYDDGIENVENAINVDDVQRCYNDINKKVEEFKQGHLKEMAALDSTFAKIEEAKMTFTKACCIKASSFDGFIKDSNGVVIGINDAGKVSPIESIEENGGLDSDDYNDSDNKTSTNPLGFTGLTPIYYKYKYSDNTVVWRYDEITVQTSEGDYIYNDEDAERYYEHYLALFFIATRIFPNYTDDESLVNYITNNISEIITNLPLDDTFPQNIREYVNKIYYDNKDEMGTLHISERGYGYIKCTFYYNCNRNSPGYFRVMRDDKNNGRLVIE